MDCHTILLFSCMVLNDYHMRYLHLDILKETLGNTLIIVVLFFVK